MFDRRRASSKPDLTSSSCQTNSQRTTMGESRASKSLSDLSTGSMFRRPSFFSLGRGGEAVSQRSTPQRPYWNARAKSIALGVVHNLLSEMREKRDSQQEKLERSTTMVAVMTKNGNERGAVRAMMKLIQYQSEQDNTLRLIGELNKLAVNLDQYEPQDVEAKIQSMIANANAASNFKDNHNQAALLQEARRSLSFTVHQVVPRAG